METDADPVALAKAFEGLRFPGPRIADAALDAEGRHWYFRCRDKNEPYCPSYRLLRFTQDEKTQRFMDPAGVYPALRHLRSRLRGKPNTAPGENWWEGLAGTADSYQAAMDAGLILARYTKGPPPIPEIAESLRELPRGIPPGPEEQRMLLLCLLVSERPDLGFELLKLCGFIGEFWQEIAVLGDVDHSKECHPEGNVWNHTMETFRHRKTRDLRLSLGLLLHDSGKPLARSSGNRRFDGHAELGAAQARRFLKRLGFDEPFIEDVGFLVRNHMLPAALPRLAITRIREVVESPLFPTLLELYRCDEASSFKSLEGYYASSGAYRAYIRRNPAGAGKIPFHKK